jgi:hypothetical protein
VLERVYNKLISELIYDCIARQVIESILIFYRPLCMKKDKTFVLRDEEHIYSQSGLHILVYWSHRIRANHVPYLDLGIITMKIHLNIL